MLADIAKLLLLLAGGLAIIGILTKSFNPKGDLISPWFFGLPAVILGLVGVLLLWVAQSTHTANTGDYGMAVVHILRR